MKILFFILLVNILLVAIQGAALSPKPIDVANINKSVDYKTAKRMLDQEPKMQHRLDKRKPQAKCTTCAAED